MHAKVTNGVRNHCMQVGGHKASSTSLATIMTALYFKGLLPHDRVAVKPHASPILHSIFYLMGKQTRDNMMVRGLSLWHMYNYICTTFPQRAYGSIPYIYRSSYVFKPYTKPAAALLLQNFRGYGGVQSYPSLTKDLPTDIDYSTGSVGLGAAVTTFSALLQACRYMNDAPVCVLRMREKQPFLA